jgi:succinate dehydrogenase/fumarate reductase cytochrome b subunit
MRDRTLWILQIAAGGMVLVLLAVHMATMHLDATLGVLNPAGGSPVGWDNVAARGRSIGFLAGYVLLLGAALVHGLLGFRGILLELSPAPAVRRTLAALLLGVGLGLLVLGSWAAWAGFALARGA